MYVVDDLEQGLLRKDTLPLSLPFSWYVIFLEY
jgi:hypothetical protein